MEDDRITIEELYGLFGGELPMEVVQIIFKAPPDKTVAQVRKEVTEYAMKLASKAIQPQ